MRRLFSITILVVGCAFGILIGKVLPPEVAALPPKGQQTGPCQCGCAETGKCDCPNCSVGCGFLPVAKKLPNPPK